MSNRLPSKPRPGKLAKTDRIIDLIDYLAAEKGNAPDIGEFDSPANYRVTLIGQIVNYGPTTGDPPVAQPDYSDNRYWVRAMYIKRMAGPRAIVKLLPSRALLDGRLITVVNLAEQVGTVTTLLSQTECSFPGGHGLSPGTFVEIFPLSGSRTDGDEFAHWVMFAGGLESRGQYQWMGHVMVSNNQDGWDFDRVHPLL